ncbi:MAG: hypothetical protein QOE59_2733 [Actinomycetota bacterium]|jgi:hypothetical protein|nr:hypothetical protein [Actinomycetota bacterium]
MDVGGAWERLLHTPTTWIVVAVVLFVVAVVLLVAGARAGRAARRQRESAAVAPGVVDDDPVTEPSVPRRDPSPSGPVGEVVEGDVEEDPVTEPSAPRAVTVPGHPEASAVQPVPDRPDDAAAHRLLGVLVEDPSAAVAGVAALQRGEEPGPAAVTLLRSGVPASAVAALCGVDADDLGVLVASALGVLPDRARAVVEEPSAEETVSL